MIHVEDRDRVRVLRMEHGKVQAMDLELLEQLDAAFCAAAQSSCRAVILTGTGGAFSAGVDLKRLLADGDSYVRRFFPALVGTLRTLVAFPKPVVAAINGHAIAGGCVVAAACDHRLLADGNGRVGVPELLVGVSFPAVVIEIMRAVVPPQHLQEVVYTGRNYPAAEALAKGLVNALVPAAELDARAMDAARAFSELPPRGFELAKRQINGPTLDRVDRFRREIDVAGLEHWRAAETGAAIQAFLDRTVGKKG